MEPEIFPMGLEDLDEELLSVLTYWKKLAGERPMPSWSKFELVKIPPRVLVTTHVTDVIAGWDDYLVRFWGTGFVDIHGQEATNCWVSEIEPPELGTAVVDSIRSVIKARAPRAFTILLQTPGRHEKFQVVLRLPLSDDGQTVNHVVTVSRFPQGRYRSQGAFKEPA